MNSFHGTIHPHTEIDPTCHTHRHLLVFLQDPTHEEMAPKRPRPLAALLIFIIVISVFVVITINHIRSFNTTNTTKTTALERLHASLPSSIPTCSFITPPSHLFSYNSRSFCRYPRACITTTSIHLPSAQPLCSYLTSTLIPHSEPRPCTDSEKKLITCAYTEGMRDNAPSCTTPLPLPLSQHNQFQQAVFVPRYPYLTNIFHFANTITTLVHLTTLHSPFLNDSLTLIFSSPANKNSWQASFLPITLSRIRQFIPQLNVRYLQPGETVCAQNVLILGRRGHVNVWPFPNTTAIDGYATEVPVDSVRFRESFYQEYSISARLPNESDMVVGHPPPVLGYARRLGPGTVTGGNVHAIGTARRFNQTDETWFQAMLQQETTAFGVQLRVFTTSSEDSLEDQVTNFATLGGVIGIHGANLVNSMFMPPLSVIIEVFPANATSQCYYTGGNAGLRYIRFESHDPATPEESGCFSGRCLKLNRQRVVKISREEERTRLREAVRQGLRYLTGLRERFPDGVHVTENPVTGMYEVVQ